MSSSDAFEILLFALGACIGYVTAVVMRPGCWL